MNKTAVNAALIAFGLSTFTAIGAHADPSVQPSNTTTPTSTETSAQKDDGSNLKRFALELNPLSIIIGRYSISGEYMFAKHHAVTLTPFYTHVPVTVTANGKETDAGALDGFGGELGYRFYTGGKGPNGFFVGPSVLFGSFSQSAPSGVNPAGSAGSQSFASYGGAVDVGGQAVIGPGVVVGGGFGLQYTTNSEELNTENLNLASLVIASGGVRPRFLLSVGYAF